MFLKILNGILIGTYATGTLITILNNSASNSRIKRKGYEILPITENSVLENIKYFIKDFGFLIIPVYNLVHSIQHTAKKDSEFDNDKIEKLSDRDRLTKVEVKKESPKKLPERREPKLTEESTKSPVKKDFKVVERTDTPSLPERKTKSLEEMSPNEKMEFYKNEFYNKKYLRDKAKADGASIRTLNTYTEELKMLKSEYNKAKQACELEKLKELRNLLGNDMSSEKKLTR